MIEVRGRSEGATIHAFGDTVRRVLTVLSDNDPARANCMRKSYIGIARNNCTYVYSHTSIPGKRGWWFEFAGEPIFVTSFAPCYPSTSSRFAFNCDLDSCFVLFQPEYSFAWRNVDDDPRNTHTEWDQPKSARDRIRVAFRDHGRFI